LGRRSRLHPRQTTDVYDSIGWLSSQVAPLGNASGGTPSQYTTGYTTNAFGNPLTVTDPLGHITTSGYDANQNRTSVIDANTGHFGGCIGWRTTGGSMEQVP